MPSGLLFIAALDLHRLFDGFPVGKAGLFEEQGRIIALPDLGLNHLELLLPDAVEKGLAILRIRSGPKRPILLHHPGKSCGDLVLIGLVFRAIGHIGIGCREMRAVVEDGGIPRRNAVSRFRDAELCDSADIPRAELGDLDGLTPPEDIELSDLLHALPVYIVDLRALAERPGADLHEAVLPHEGIDDGLEDLGAQRGLGIELRAEVLPGGGVHSHRLGFVWSREILLDDLKEDVKALSMDAGAHQDGGNAAGPDILLQRILDLLYRKLLPGEVFLHILVGGLCHRLQEGASRDAEIFLNIVRDIAGLVLIFLRETAARHLYDIDKADEFLVLADRKLEGGDGAAEALLQVQYKLTEGGMVIIHIGDKEESRKLLPLAELPGLYGSGLDAGLAVYDDDCGVGGGDRLLHLTHKVEVSRAVQDIDFVLALFPLVFNRNEGSGDRELPPLLLLLIIGNRISVRNGSHSLDRPRHIGESLRDCGLSRPAVAQENYIPNASGVINLHILFPSCRRAH